MMKGVMFTLFIAIYDHLLVNNILCNVQFGLGLVAHVICSCYKLYRNGHVWLTKVKDVISSILITVKPLTLFLIKDC